ncbi:DUF7933 domain-containing protein [Gilvimarinus sp. 1_MG-2023]|uniref:DUF7933 domain-containing protein n=1 Tax=Gilvimarinus sp. 1_MG-2023 TaxID=3062638 RepID=UPI0026E1E9D9|nr:hypothetical protein [Gilvimarinus sp. 1_MG-2023]MDO6746277.1 hypothetical protein [Gilvimarinus sp. 1_MG-2023]
MNSKQLPAIWLRALKRAVGVLTTTFFALTFASGAMAQPVFSKTFSPDSIGPGSVSTLTFTITNGSASQVSALAFTDVLPTTPGVITIADPAFATNTCGGTLSAPAGGGTITLSGGGVAGSASCQVKVDVTGSTAGTHSNASGDLTSSAGNSGIATDDLIIDSNYPGFSKTFSPTSVQLGEVSTLTFTIDNTLGGNDVGRLAFTDALPAGLEIASPTNAMNGCGEILSAPAGGTAISYTADFTNNVPTLAASETCNISVDVQTTGVGQLDNRSSVLSYGIYTYFGEISIVTSNSASGMASDSIEVMIDELALTKSFIDDPVAPGGTATLEFSITNFNRTEAATSIAFTDDLDATLSGLAITGGLPASPCGGGSSLVGTDTLTFTGGSLAGGESCTFSVQVAVPGGAVAGVYTNITSSLSSSAGTFSPATGALHVGYAPVLLKEFCEPGAPAADPCVELSQVEGGELVTARFTVTNPDPDNAVTGLTFDDDIGAFMAGATGVTGSQSDICGAGSLFFAQTVNDSLVYRLNDGSLAAGGSCTFQVDLQLPDSISSGTYVNETTPISGEFGGPIVVGNQGVAQVSSPAVPRLTKSFADPVGAGQTVELEFTLIGDEALDFSNMAFTDDLDAALSGLTVTSYPLGPCGGSLSVTGGNNLELSGASVAAGESCLFTVTLQVPMAAAPGSYPSTTSMISATTVNGPAQGAVASDNLDITFVEFQKNFLDDPVAPGQTVTLEFHIENLGDSDLTGLTFTDDLDASLSGLTPVDTAAQNDICGAGSSLTFLGGNILILTGGNLSAGENCSFSIVLQVPAAAAAGDYNNVTSNLSGTYDGNGFDFSGASDNLQVSDPLALSKAFTDDPSVPGGMVTLEFTVTNLSANDTVSDITFTDDLGAVFAGLVSSSGIQNNVCGTGSSLSGSSILTLADGELGPGASCTFSATLSIPASASGNAYSTSSVVTGSIGIDDGGVSVEGNSASDTLNLNNVTFAKSFSGPTTAAGTVTLSFTLENLDVSNSVGGLSFTDDLDAVITGLVATDTPQSDICGVGSQISGTDLLIFTGGELGPNESCSIDVELLVPASAAPGSYDNTTSHLTSNGLLVADVASADLQIEPPPTFVKVFAPNAIALNGTSTLTFTIDNSASAVAANSLAFTDNLPAGLVVAGVPNVSSTCTGGTLTAVAGAVTISLNGASVAAGSSCTLQVDIVGNTEGTLVNTTGSLMSSSGDSGTATDTIDVVTGAFVLIKSLRTQPVLPGGLVEMELSIVNGSAFALTSIALTDNLNAVIPGLVAEGLPIAGVCGAGSQVTGTSIVTLTGGNLPAGGSCTVVVPVRVPADASTGTFTNTTSVASGIRGAVAVEAAASSADLVVEALTFTKTFDSGSADAGGSTGITFDIINPDPANAVTGLTFTDDLEAFMPGMTATSTPISDACGAGSLVDGTSIIELTGGSLAAGGSCSFQVELSVPTSAAGEYTNVSGELTSDLGNNGNATAVLLINGRPYALPLLSSLWLGLLALLLAVIGWLALRAARLKVNAG